LPLPYFTSADLTWTVPVDDSTRAAVTDMLRISAASLNFMACPGKHPKLPRSVHVHHVAVLNRMLGDLLTLVLELDKLDRDVAVAGAFQRTVDVSESAKFPDLCASRVDVATNCAKVDPLLYMSSEHAATLSDPSLLFLSGVRNLPRRVMCTDDSLR
jgi:hypothetical protein